jgi:hypothetical protein
LSRAREEWFVINAPLDPGPVVRAIGEVNRTKGTNMFKTIHKTSLVIASACPIPSRAPSIATVRHIFTNEPLVGMPVFVTSISKGGEWDCQQGGVTNKAGVVEIGPLPDGAYKALVYYNEVSSEPVYFKIAGRSMATITILFNPDIDDN